MWFARRKKRKDQSRLTPPAGRTAADIRTQSSICTGETLIGFLDPQSGNLQQAVVIRSRQDMEAFYRSYGWEPPCRN